MQSTLLSLFSQIYDPHRGQGKMYPRAPILLFTVLAMLAGARSYHQVHAFIRTHLDRLSRDSKLGRHSPRLSPRNQRMSVQTGPGSPVAIAEPEFLLELLVHLPHTQRALIAAASRRSEVRAGRLLR